MNGWTGGQYSILRVALGLYLAWHFAVLIPWAKEVFSRSGMLPRAELSPLVRAFPSIFVWFDEPWMVQAALGVAIVASLCFAIGWRDRWSALLVWYLWAALLVRNPLMRNPSIPYIVWMLLAHACLPSAAYGSWRARDRVYPGGGWHFPAPLFALAWILMAFGYSYSGLMKLSSPSWLNGDALAATLQNPLARPGWIRDFVLAMPKSFMQVASYGVLALELFFAPLAGFRKLRPWL
ncbi:MAG: hypothetical protein OHK0021_00770 [Bryobacter sp.]